MDLTNDCLENDLDPEDLGIDFAALREAFKEESAEFLDLIETSLIKLENRPDEMELVEEIYRAVHSLKGSAWIVGLENVVEFTHILEDLLENLSERALRVDEEMITLLLSAVDASRRIIDYSMAGADELAPEHEALKRKLAGKNSFAVSFEEGGTGESTGDGEYREESSSVERSKTLRVEVEKLYEIKQLVKEITAARDNLTLLILDENGATRDDILRTHLNAAELFISIEEHARTLLMAPIGDLFREHSRTVRDLSIACGKGGRLVTEGDEIEVEATTIELLRTPLTHMIRNAVYHGIEPAGVRMERGKPPLGQIALRASLEENALLIQVSDDGGGLKREKLLTKARRMGLIGELDSPTADELYRLVFLPGFSTVESVNEISGRGIGMDIVRNSIEAAGGSVDIQSWEGEGATITIRLPRR